MTRDTTERMIVIRARMPLLIALSFHVTAVMSVVSARMTDIIALVLHVIQVMCVTAARTIDLTEVLSVSIRFLRLVIGMMRLTKKVLSVLIVTVPTTRPRPVSPRGLDPTALPMIPARLPMPWDHAPPGLGPLTRWPSP